MKWNIHTFVTGYEINISILNTFLFLYNVFLSYFFLKCTKNLICSIVFCGQYFRSCDSFSLSAVFIFHAQYYLFICLQYEYIKNIFLSLYILYFIVIFSCFYIKCIQKLLFYKNDKTFLFNKFYVTVLQLLCYFGYFSEVVGSLHFQYTS